MTSAQFESHGPVSKCLTEENMKCALGLGGMHHINQDSFTGEFKNLFSHDSGENVHKLEQIFSSWELSAFNN